MTTILPVKGILPKIGENCYLAPNATIVGDVIIGKDCSIWFNAVVRGDVNKITIGERTNVQDGAIIHCTYQTAETIIGSDVSIGHNAIVHGCTLKDNVLIGMGAIVMDHAIVESGAIVAAGAVVLEKTVVKANAIYAGVPAKYIKPVGDPMKGLFERTAKNYVMYGGWFN